MPNESKKEQKSYGCLSLTIASVDLCAFAVCYLVNRSWSVTLSYDNVRVSSKEKDRHKMRANEYK